MKILGVHIGLLSNHMRSEPRPFAWFDKHGFYIGRLLVNWGPFA